MSRSRTAALATIAVFWSAGLSVSAQGERPASAPSSRPALRAAADVEWRDEDDALRPVRIGRTDVEYGAVAWGEAGRKALRGRTWRWRLGADAWTTLRTDVPLHVGGVRVAPGRYALIAAKSKDGYAIELLAEDLFAAADPANMEKAPHGVVVPAKLADLPKLAPELSIAFDREPGAPRGTLNAPRRLLVAYGPHVLSTSVVLDRKGATPPPCALAAARAALAKEPRDAAVDAAVGRALDWFVRHQAPDGRWEAHGFGERGDPARGPLCDGRGLPHRDVEVTGLVLSAFLAEGTHVDGPYRDPIRRGLTFLLSQQLREGNLSGAVVLNRSLIVDDTASAVRALAEAYALTGSERLRVAATAGLERLVRLAAPYRSYGHAALDEHPNTYASVAAAFALSAGMDAGLAVDVRPTLGHVAAFVVQMTEQDTGRVGVFKKGERPLRLEGKMLEFPPENSEDATAAGLCVRLLHDPKSAALPENRAGVELLLRRPPVYRPHEGQIDYRYWWWGATALRAGARSKEAAAWRSALTKCLLSAQRTDGNFLGSWDNVDAWGDEHGRPGATALATLCLLTPRRVAAGAAVDGKK